MGYDVHIMRGSNWWEADEIPVDEWAAAIESSPDLHRTGAVEALSYNGDAVRYDSPLLAEWSGHPSGRRVSFDYRGGRVIVKGPDTETLTRMADLARLLRARVQGDEGEFYGESS